MNATSVSYTKKQNITDIEDVNDRVKNYINNKNKGINPNFFCVENLVLYTIPESISTIGALKTLKISNCRLENIIGIKDLNLETLDISNNQISMVNDQLLPLTLTHLFINDNTLTFLDVSNLKLKELHIDNCIDYDYQCHGVDMEIKLCNTIETLSMDSTTFEHYDFLSKLKKLKKLDMTNCDLASNDMFHIPYSVEELCISNTGIDEIVDLPNSLVKLVADENANLTEFNINPYRDTPNLTYLDISNCNLKTIPKLPEKMKHLDLSYNENLQFEIKNLPKFIGEKLDVTNTGTIADIEDSVMAGGVRSDIGIEFDKYTKMLMDKNHRVEICDDYHATKTNYNFGSWNFNSNTNSNNNYQLRRTDPDKYMKLEIEKAKNDKKTEFSIYSCDISEIPVIDIDNLQKLSITGCNLDYLANVPNVKYLSVVNNKITTILPNTFPDTVETVNLSHNPIESIDISGSNIKELKLSRANLTGNVILNDCLEKLTIHDSTINMKNFVLGTNLKELVISNLQNLTGDDIHITPLIYCSKLEYLEIKKCNVDSINCLSNLENINYMCLSEVNIRDQIRALPCNINKLEMISCSHVIFNMKMFPNTINELKIVTCNVWNFPKFDRIIVNDINFMNTTINGSFTNNNLPLMVSKIKINGLKIQSPQVMITFINKAKYSDSKFVTDYHTVENGIFRNQYYRSNNSNGWQWNPYQQNHYNCHPHNLYNQRFIEEQQERARLHREQMRILEEKRKKVRENMNKLTSDGCNIDKSKKINIDKYIDL